MRPEKWTQRPTSKSRGNSDRHCCRHTALAAGGPGPRRTSTPSGPGRDLEATPPPPPPAQRQARGRFTPDKAQAAAARRTRTLASVPGHRHQPTAKDARRPPRCVGSGSLVERCSAWGSRGSAAPPPSSTSSSSPSQRFQLARAAVNKTRHNLLVRKQSVSASQRFESRIIITPRRTEKTERQQQELDAPRSCT